MISSWVTESAPWRLAVPMQSEPVSPPPITTTCLPVGEDRLALLGAGPALRRFCWVEIVHREMDAAELAAGHGEVARLLGAAGEDEDVIIVHQPLDRDGDADLHIGAEDDALHLHLGDAPVDQHPVHLEVGDAVAEQAADPVGLLEHGRRMAHAGELLRAGEAGRAGADDRDRACRCRAAPCAA